VLPSGAPIALYDDAAVEPRAPVLQVVQRKINLPAKQFRPPDELEAEAAVRRAEMNRLRREGSVDEIRLATAKATQAGWRAENARNYYGMKTIPWELMAIRIGEIALVSVPGEPFTETAQQVAALSPFPQTLFSGYSNGGFGYIPVREAYREGGYEIEATPFSADAAEVLVAESVRLLKELAGRSAYGE